MKRRLFSGTSLRIYENLFVLPIMTFPMFTEDIRTALTYATRRAREDKSIGIIIEITKVEDFNIKKTSGGYYVKGTLKKENHKVYMKEDLEKLLPILKKTAGINFSSIKEYFSSEALRFLGY